VVEEPMNVHPGREVEVARPIVLAVVLVVMAVVMMMPVLGRRVGDAGQAREKEQGTEDRDCGLEQPSVQPDSVAHAGAEEMTARAHQMSRLSPRENIGRQVGTGGHFGLIGPLKAPLQRG
jgi:flagellar biosynthesis/type III secretory pathway M-ring protein FliF/YscJ